ncbi:PPE domain-containing protein [Gordonia sp. ABSL1-1]|uniref:PPE domain-containing protein n=1 Tax=Gordonia sp. ABSL1-1 TaxID=3053923 RepID=UPI0025746EA1|nr:PPE domain-containing protein [Gordonia sp. ABSL1-1]MDL9937756.1 PPE domain-containing protein [Gordonia sp. ABSL1-1]
MVWASRDLKILAQQLIAGAGAGPMGEAGHHWVTVAKELAEIATDYRKLLHKLGESWDSSGSQEARAKLESFGKWLDKAALEAATNAQRAEAAAVGHAVAVIAMPSVPEAVKLQEALAVGKSLQAFPNGLMIGALGAGDAALQAATANAVGIMTSYEHTVTPLAQPWTAAPPPNIAKSQAEMAKGDKANGGSGVGAGAGGGMGGVGAVPTPLTAPTPMTVAGNTNQRSSRVVAASATSGGMAGAPGGPMGAMGRGNNDDKEFESNRPAASLTEAGEARPAGSGFAAASNFGAFSVDSVSWGPETGSFSGTGGQSAPEEIFDPDSRQMERASSEDWVSPSVFGERGTRV